MRSNGGDRNLDLILEKDRRTSGKQKSGVRRGNAADVQLWTDDRDKQPQRRRYKSREEEMRYRRELRRKKRRRQVFVTRMATGILAFLLLCGIGAGLWKIGKALWKKVDSADSLTAMQMQEEQQLISGNQSPKPVILEDFLTPNEYSRPGEALPEVTEIFVHYTANAGTSAAQNRSYFENLGITGETSASAHFVIGSEGEIVQCLPLDEIGYAVKEHNYNSISIECCYLKEDGKFEDATYQSLIALLGWLMKEYDLGPSAIKRHYDASGKLCPLYYVEHEEAWEQLKKDVEEYLLQYGSEEL
ncbi:MAG: peptidoglycan recognition family protein [Eubacteriales bacterium]|nr:peptidoglycan recognition family protein [Eubacteriales bacterium]